LKAEFEVQNIITDFEFGQYDCMEDTLISYHYVQMSGSNEPFQPVMHFPKLTKDNYYFGVFFPHRKDFVRGQLSIWTLSSVFLVCVLIFLAYIILLLLKQKRLSEVQKDFVNNMTHEFKTPLASIQLSAEVLKDPKIIEKPQRLLNYATIIDNEASQLALQVERVLHMAHAERGEIHLRQEEFVWQDLIKEIAHNFGSSLERQNARLKLEMPEAAINFTGDKLHLK